MEEAEDAGEEEAQEEEEVEKEEEEVEVEEEFNLGKSDDQRAGLPQPPALLVRHKIAKHEIISKTDKNIFSILSQHCINAKGFKGLNDKCSPKSSLRSLSEFCCHPFCLLNSSHLLLWLCQHRECRYQPVAVFAPTEALNAIVDPAAPNL